MARHHATHAHRRLTSADRSLEGLAPEPAQAWATERLSSYMWMRLTPTSARRIVVRRDRAVVIVGFII